MNMMTSARFSVSWCYREGEKSIRRTLYHSKIDGCIEAARLISGNPYAFDVDVREVDTGKCIDWTTPQIGSVIYQPSPVEG
jgi:hypothetical protein